jgi:murein L,D-transpeptidase YcbB/YkuD
MRKIVRGLPPLGRIFAAGSGLAALAFASPVVLPIASAHAAAAPAFDSEIADFYRSRGGAPLWFGPTARDAAPQLLQLLATAQADHLNPRRYNVRGLANAVASARTGNPAAVQRAEAMLSAAFVTYARDMKHDPGVGIIYVDSELKPEPPSARELLAAAAQAPSLTDYVQQMGWMNPIYANLRQALASRIYSNQAQYRLLSLNLERARALP